LSDVSFRHHCRCRRRIDGDLLSDTDRIRFLDIPKSSGFLIVVGLTIAATMIKFPLSGILIAFPVGLKAAFTNEKESPRD